MAGTANAVRTKAQHRKGATKHRGPERRCVVTGAHAGPADLIRFVLDPAGTVVPDLAARLPGRGVWVTCSRACVAQAVTKGAFARGFRKQVAASPDLPDQIASLLRARICNRISLANKAGAALAGFTKVETAIRAGDVAVVLHASDGAPDGCGKLDALARASEAVYARAPRISSILSGTELSLALGRSNVIHAALKHGGPGAAFLEDVTRLERYAAMDGAEALPAGTPGTGDPRYTETA